MWKRHRISTRMGLCATLLAAAPHLHGQALERDVRYPSGDLTLAALLISPPGPGPHPGAVIVQGSGDSDRTNQWSRDIADVLVGNGLAVLLTDKRGSGASEGDWRTAGFDELADDALAGVAFLESLPDIDPERVGLVGLSQGGWIVPVAAARGDVAFVVDVSGASVSFAEQSYHEMANTTRQAGFGAEAVAGVLELNRAAGDYLLTGDWDAYLAARERGLETPWAEIAAGFPAERDATIWTFLRKVFRFDPAPYWLQIDEPVFVAFGAGDERDNVPVDESVRRLEFAFGSVEKTDYEILVVPGVGHGIRLEEHPHPLAPTFTGALGRWLEEHALGNGDEDAEPRPFALPGSGWRYETVDLRIELAPDGRSLTVRGSATLRLTAESSAGPTLLLRTNDGESERSTIEFESLEPATGEVVSLNEDVPDRPGLISSTIRLPEPVERGRTLDMTFVIRAEGVRNQFTVDPEYATASWTSAWYPVPAPGEGESFGSGLIATRGRLTFDLPAGWRAVSSGDLAERIEDGERATEVWVVEEPRALGFAAGPFTYRVIRAGERAVAVYRLSAEDATVDAQAGALDRVIDAMADRFGEYPYARFSIAEAPDRVPGFWGASEQGFILAKPTVFASEDGNLPLFAHEAAHAWWGNLVGTDGDGGIFLSESLAQYGAALAIETLEGEAAATSFLRFSRPEYIQRQCARGYFQVIRDGEDRPISAIEEGGGVNHTIADAKGHWVHHMLRRRVGDAVYFGTLRELKERFSDRAMTLVAFRDAFIDAAPDARLERFFEQWLDRTGAPVLDLDWRAAGSDSIDVTITQRQGGEPYELDLEIEMVGVGSPRLETITVDELEQTVRVASPFRTNVVWLDPNHRVLRWTPEYGSRPPAEAPVATPR